MSYVNEMFDLSDTIAVITGGGGILAGAIAKALIQAGARVSVWGRGRSVAMDEVVAQLGDETGAGERIHGVTVDTSKEKEVEGAYRKTSEELQEPNLLVNGVGGNKGKADFVDQDMKTFEEVLHMNLVAGLMVPSKVFGRNWIEHGIKGTMINISSMTSYIPLSGVWGYNAAKAAVKNLTMGAAKEFAPYEIRVNGIAPGFFIGKQNKDLLIKNEATGELTERGQAIIDHTPFARFGEADEVAGSVIFLASKKAAGFVTGVTIPIDGGYLIHNI